MLNHYNLTTNELVALAPEILASWAANGNPKANDYAPLPPKPSEDATWGNGQWVTPAAQSYTAEEWTDSQGFGGNRSTTLLYQSSASTPPRNPRPSSTPCRDGSTA